MNFKNLLNFELPEILTNTTRTEHIIYIFHALKNKKKIYFELKKVDDQLMIFKI